MAQDFKNGKTVMEKFMAGMPNSVSTRDGYGKGLQYFLAFAETTPEEFAAMEGAQAGNLIEGYIAHLNEKVKARELAPGTVRTRLSPVRLFALMNTDAHAPLKDINWPLLMKQVPKGRQHADDRAPTREEVRTLLNHTLPRMKAAILLMCGSGLRLGGLAGLNVGDITEAPDGSGAGRVVVYRGEPESYVTFTTPESMRAIKEYLDFRRKHGEDVGPSSPLLRDVFDTRGGKGRVGSPRRVPADVIEQDIARLWARAGVRAGKAEGRRHPFKAVHSFRKYYKTAMENAGVKPVCTEVLMGHEVGISGSYYRPTEADLLAEFLKAVPDLSIGDEERQRAEMGALESRHAQGVERLELAELKKDIQVSTLSSEVERLKSEIQRREAAEADKDETVKALQTQVEGLADIVQEWGKQMGRKVWTRKDGSAWFSEKDMKEMGET
ncbi:MAG: tyrosine-type recombinase/integrase [Nitrososphaerales archaeon]|jgi:integrase